MLCAIGIGSKPCANRALREQGLAQLRYRLTALGISQGVIDRLGYERVQRGLVTAHRVDDINRLRQVHPA